MTTNSDGLARLHAAIMKLTDGERECLDHVAGRLGSKEIARKLSISPHTVDARLKSACAKLGTNSRFVAAQIVAGATQVTVTAPDTNLVYEPSGLPNQSNCAEKEASAGEGYGSDDLDPHQRPTSDSNLGSELRALRPEAKSPYATFFGGENRLSIGRRLIYIAAIAIGIAVAFGGITNGLVELSKIFSSP